MEKYLWLKWCEAFEKSHIELEETRVEFKRIIDAYSQEHRCYHNLNHLNHLLRQCDEIKMSSSNILLSIFYHDVIYNPKWMFNERRSARFAKLSLKKISFDQNKIHSICGMILATRDHSISTNSETELFLDLDLSILGSSSRKYINYSISIRNEYVWMPDSIYFFNRKKFLNKFLRVDKIFHTRHFQNKYEERARKNLESELVRIPQKD
jgi:predicted metal-dependent HD superfamily phosphohydrolase